MAISNYTELQASISDYMARNDISGKASEFIALAEARLNRKLGTIASTIILSGVAGQNFIDITALNIVEPVSLFVEGTTREFLILPRPQGTFAYSEIAATPTKCAVERVLEAGVEKTYLRFDRDMDAPYTFRFTYQGRFALSDATPTNDFLTNFPDVYMAAAIVWGCIYTKSVKDGAMWKSVLEEGLLEARNTYAKSKRAVLTVDPMLSGCRRPGLNLDIAT
ncbi:phage adaptor protein [Rhizobium sp. GR12]|uniref:phage adaptor protein n=1 Tax=Rhizobium sp. GR12 TaxID=3053925 RepID=UPI002FBD308A